MDLRANKKITSTRNRRHSISNFIISASMVFSHPYVFSLVNMKIHKKLTGIVELQHAYHLIQPTTNSEMETRNKEEVLAKAEIMG